MGLPKRKTSHAAQGDRRAHSALTPPTLVACPHCHEPKLIHHVCPTCGYYGGREVVRIKAKAPKGEAARS
jgi:large subunit ribosomal protein L32